MGYNKHTTAVIDEGVQIGDGTKIWHFSHIMSDAVIGENCYIGQNVFIDNGVIIGQRVKKVSQRFVFSAVTQPSHFSAVKFYTVSIKLLSTLLNITIPKNNANTINIPE